MKKIAVTLPVYRKDKSDYFHLAVDSILKQSYTGFKLFVGVDGPVGNDLKNCISIYEKQDNVTVVWFPENRGLACVLNDLIDCCFGWYNVLPSMNKLECKGTNF